MYTRRAGSRMYGKKRGVLRPARELPTRSFLAGPQNDGFLRVIEELKFLLAGDLLN
jgi:hypothetical protein